MTQDSQINDTSEQKPQEIAKELLDILVCPLTKAPLIYDKQANELISKSANLAYPIHNGIPIMLPSEARNLTEPDKDPKTS